MYGIYAYIDPPLIGIYGSPISRVWVITLLWLHISVTSRLACTSRQGFSGDGRYERSALQEAAEQALREEPE